MKRLRALGPVLGLFAGLLVTPLSPGGAEPRAADPVPSLLDAVDGRDLAGRTWNRDELRGRIVLVEFWATWCLPCLEQLPDLSRTYQRFHEAGFEILAVSLDRGARRDVRRSIRLHDIPWPVLYDGQGFAGSLARRFRIESVPRSILFDGAGRVLAEDLSPAALDAVLAALLPTA